MFSDLVAHLPEEPNNGYDHFRFPSVPFILRIFLSSNALFPQFSAFCLPTTTFEEDSSFNKKQRKIAACLPQIISQLASLKLNLICSVFLRVLTLHLNSNFECQKTRNQKNSFSVGKKPKKKMLHISFASRFVPDLFFLLFYGAV